MATPHLKRKLPNGQGAIMGPSGSYSPPRGVFGLTLPEPPPRDCRKRSRNDMPLWVKHTLTPYFDGHLWRKYGQKDIKDSLFPRLYYRCSYFEERKCPALKKVQQSNFDDPPLFAVIYEHEHTCGAVPVPAPDVDDMVAEAERPAGSDGMVVLRFGSSSSSSSSSGGGGGYGDAHTRMQQEWRQQYSQPQPPLPRSMFLMTSFDSSSGHLHEQQPAAFPFDLPPAVASWLSSFPVTETSPAPPAVDDEGGMFSTWEWDSFRHSVDDQLQFGDHAQLPGHNSGSFVSWETNECSLAHWN
ncbi:hypothetical protein ACP4OV_024460 [Aristida adscensionis]